MSMAAPAFASDPPRGSDLAAYVRARAADAEGASDVAARGYALALAADPGNEVIAIRAFREGVSVGDLALARRALTVLETSRVAPADAALLRFADQVEARDWDGARATATRVGQGPLSFVGPVLRAWIAVETGGGDPLAELGKDADNAVERRYSAEAKALILVAMRRDVEANAALQTLLAEGGGLDVRIAAARLYAGRGDMRTARALLAGEDPAARAQLSALGRGAKPGAAFGAATLFTRLAGDLSGEEPSPLVILLTRTALMLEPANDRARLLLADALSRDGSGMRALALIQEVRPKSPWAREADTLRIAVLDRMGQRDAAIALATKRSAAKDATADDARTLGDLLVASGRFGEAADAYGAAMTREGGTGDWVLNLQRGGAIEQAGRFEEALPYLRRAVELAPDEPVALNYLGYALAERGRDLPEAQALLEKARRLKPDDASITDSLGFAYARRGQTAKALPLLEQAAAAQPGDVEINEHLGDAYWASGRRYEARYAWRAASVHAEGADKTRLAAKLERGPAAE
ncbi:tetratricopeptide (TPR) repeat protein [Sphingomonas yantingensis]|uniref:Tetratricopeptide (TPR) repeat protein n=2 Tax=Sphingomonas yantingensis TaxID=1241761 RepID=A0A7W9ANT6_9SPHN|nr:tetratricopeptide (TPR) repeat protein [Sphingomonas yantingensis]